VIAGGEHAVGHVIADHAVLHSLFVVFVEVCQKNLAHGFQRRPPLHGQPGKILRHVCHFALHKESVYAMEAPGTTKIVF